MRDHFGAALRQWRKRRGISQLELAVRAGTTQRHLSFLESGRSTPGRAIVVRLAESLEVPLRERNALLQAAGFAPAYGEKRLDDPSLQAVRTALKRVLDGHMPYPAVLVDRNADLVDANEAFWTLMAPVAAHLLEPPVNVARVLLHPQGLAPHIANLDEWAWHVVIGLRAEATRDPSPRLQAVLAELEPRLPTPEPGPDYLGFAVPLRLRAPDAEMRLLTTLTRFGTADDATVADLRLEAFLPADEPTARLLTGLAGIVKPLAGTPKD